jgi:ferredoxin
MCGICVIQVVHGLENLSRAEESESWFLESLGHPEPEKRLACQCRLRGDVTICQA